MSELNNSEIISEAASDKVVKIDNNKSKITRYIIPVASVFVVIILVFTFISGRNKLNGKIEKEFQKLITLEVGGKAKNIKLVKKQTTSPAPRKEVHYLVTGKIKGGLFDDNYFIYDIICVGVGKNQNTTCSRYELTESKEQFENSLDYVINNLEF